MDEKQTTYNSFFETSEPSQRLFLFSGNSLISETDGFAKQDLWPDIDFYVRLTKKQSDDCEAAYTAEICDYIEVPISKPEDSAQCDNSRSTNTREAFNMALKRLELTLDLIEKIWRASIPHVQNHSMNIYVKFEPNSKWARIKNSVKP